MMTKRSSTEGTRAGRVAIVGRPNVGKSSIFNALLRAPIAIVSRQPQTTRETVRGVLTEGATQYVLLDTPGLHPPRTRLGQRMNAAARDAAHEADVVLLVVAAPREGDHLGLLAEDVAVAKELGGRQPVLAVNKIDLLKDKARLLPLLAQVGPLLGEVAVVPVSAKKGTDGLQRLLRELAARLPEQPFLYEEETLSDQPLRFFAAEFVREQVLRHVRQEVPHGVAVVVERFDEGARRVLIEATVHVAREAHKKIVIGAGGRMLKAIGSAARARIEDLLSCKVHLQIQVRATPNWMDDEERLRQLLPGAGS